MADYVRQIKEENKRKRLKRQWDLLVKRADVWFKECEQPTNFVMMILRGDRVEWKDVARETEEPLELPYADSSKHSWDMLVFLIPAIFRRNGIYGKVAYRPENRPSWWPRDVRFSSPNSNTQVLMK